jgi:hypothetical protein
MARQKCLPYTIIGVLFILCCFGGHSQDYSPVVAENESLHSSENNAVSTSGSSILTRLEEDDALAREIEVLKDKYSPLDSGEASETLHTTMEEEEVHIYVSHVTLLNNRRKASNCMV